jgi:hypothetical protein
MIRFLVSYELWVTVLGMVILSFILGDGNFINGFGDLANVKQNIEWFAWAYVIHRLHRHHKHFSSLLGGEKDERDS